MEKRMNKEELLELLNTLKISREEFVILSSSAVMFRGIYESCGDLDIAVTEKGLQELKENYSLKQKDNGWYIVNDKVECVCDGEIENLKYKPERLECGYLVQNIHEYFEFLNKSEREKDKARIPLVKAYIDKL